MLNVLLVEDDLDLAASLLDMMQLEDIGCDHASNGLAGLQLLQHSEYDVLILDLNLPKLDGLSVCRQARAQGCDVPVLMLTARDALLDKLDGFDAGGDDYLVKPFEIDELLARVRALAKRRSGQAQQLQFADIRMRLDQHQAWRGERPLSLSPIGWQLLECLMRAAPSPVSRDKLIATVWGNLRPIATV
ncbi:response regulator transcription factor [Bacterioplanes sanyensis]|uniref:response regulator transcription factor n=1 Tax=Bacterioplanes sanyensis TaxID=1249553 RepID=UPI001E2CD638|nr:response regulator transcription factor [Bacterioplanes sanyensis]